MRSSCNRCGPWLLVGVTEHGRMNGAPVWMMTHLAEKESFEVGLGEDLK